MSTVNNGPQIVKTSLTFVLDPTVSAGFIKTPKQISNCIAWFDASTSNEMVSSSNIVSSWSDKSGNGYVFNSAQLSALPASNFSPLYVSNKINGLGSLYFDGSNDYMFVNSSMGLASATQYTAFVVLSPVYLNASQVAFGMQATPSGGTYEILGYWSALDTFTVGFDGGVVLVNTTSRSDNRSIIHSVVRNGTLANAYLNGFQYATNTTVASTVNSGVARLGIGANTYVNGSAPYKGYICEIIIYNRALSTTERSQVQNYLSNKWRIPLLQTTLTNRDLIFGKVATCQNNNIPVIDKSYRLNPANATGSPLQSNFYFADSVSWMSSVITTTITLEAWVKPNSFTFYGSPGNDLGTIMIANSNFYLSIDSNGKFNIYLVGAITSTVNHLPSTTSVTRHSWNHVVVTFDGAYIRWYLNGVLDKTSSTTYTLGTLLLTNYLGIGAEGAGTFGRNLDGYVAGCKIYGKALTTAEVSQNYESSKTEFSNLPNMVATNVRCYYDLDIYSSYFGSGLVDLSGGGYTATINNSPTYAYTEPKCFILNGSTQDITLPSNFNNGMTSGTWEFWLNSATLPTSGTYQQLYIQENSVWLGLYNPSGVVFFGCDLNNGSGWFDNNGGNNTGAKTTSTLSANTWYHISYSWDGSAVRIYLNGNLESTTSTLQSSNGRQNVTILGAGTTPRTIGGRSQAGYYFNGKISMFRNYNVSLSTTEVVQNYNATKFRFGL
jgi:hypothetical protein